MIENKLAITLDAVGRRYGVRPSQLVGLDAPGLEMVALSFDVEVATVGASYEQRQIDEMRKPNPPLDLPTVDEMEQFFVDLPEGSLVKKRAMEIRDRGRNG